MTARDPHPILTDRDENSVVFNLAELAGLEQSRIAQETEARVRAELAREEGARRERERAEAERTREQEQRLLSQQLARLDGDVARILEQEALLTRAQERLAQDLGAVRGHQVSLGERVLAEVTPAPERASHWLIGLSLAVALVAAGLAAFTVSRYASLLAEVDVAVARAERIDQRAERIERALAELRASAPSATRGVEAPTAASRQPIVRVTEARERGGAHPRVPPAATAMERLSEIDRCDPHDPLCGTL